MNLMKKLAIVVMILHIGGIKYSYTIDPDWNDPDINNLQTHRQLSNRIDYLAKEIAEIVSLAEEIGIYDSIFKELEEIMLEWSDFKHVQVRGYDLDYSLGLVKLTKKINKLKMKVESIADKKRIDEMRKTLIEIGLPRDLINIASDYVAIEEK